jgi:hypothetical protein
MTVTDPEGERKRIIRSRNIVVGLLLGGFAILLFAISLAKIAG